METLPPYYEKEISHLSLVRDSRFVDHVTRCALHDPRDQLYEKLNDHNSRTSQRTQLNSGLLQPTHNPLPWQPVMAPYSDAEKRKPYDGRSDAEFHCNEYNEYNCTTYLQHISCQYSNVRSSYDIDRDQNDFVNSTVEMAHNPHSKERLLHDKAYQQATENSQATVTRFNETDYAWKNGNGMRMNVHRERTSTPNQSRWNSCIEDTTRHYFPDDYGHGRWQQWPWTSHAVYASAISPSSPLDSGLSSQSLASSPSFERVPSPPPCPFVEHVSALHNVRQERKRHSCLFDSFADYSRLHTPVLRSDSGRSSPWAHSTASKLSAFAQLHRCSGNSPVERICGRHSDGFHSNQTLHSGSRSHSEQEMRNMPRVASRYDADFHNFYQTLAPKNRMYGKDRFSTPLCKHENQRDPVVFSPESLLTSSENSMNSSVPEHQITAKQISEDPYDLIRISNSTQTSISDSSSSSSRSTTTNTEHQNLLLPAFWNEGIDLDKTEKALDELEEIYQNLKLDDYDLLDRAERRDLPTCHQLAREPFPRSRLTRSKSDSLCETAAYAYRPFDATQRAPPTRRAGVPDRIADDMALRKYHKPVTKPVKRNDKLMSYMLCSAPFTPTVPVSNGLNFLNQPDLELDDLSNRRYFQSTANKQDQPQPPFGIPLHPVIQQLSSNYLRVRPSSDLQPLCHPRGNPDVVRDDMAFRNLRKDNPKEQ